MRHEPTGSAFDKIALDICELQTVTPSGNRYILVVSDYFTHWAEAYALPDHKAETVCKKLVTEWIMRHGMPRQIHSDQGRDVDGKLMRAICDLLGCEKIRTTPYTPRSDGMVERLNRSILTMLAAYVNVALEDWDEKLPFVMASFRQCVHSSTEYTPNKLVYGREVNSPIDVTFPDARLKSNGKTCPSDYVDWLRRTLELSHKVVRDTSHRAMLRQKGQYDKKVRHQELHPGNVVMYYYKPMTRRKLDCAWVGPYVVRKVHDSITYEIAHLDKADKRTVHANDIKMCLFRLSDEQNAVWRRHLDECGINPATVPRVHKDNPNFLDEVIPPDSARAPPTPVQIQTPSGALPHTSHNGDAKVDPTVTGSQNDEMDVAVGEEATLPGAEREEAPLSFDLLRRSRRTKRAPNRLDL